MSFRASRGLIGVEVALSRTVVAPTRSPRDIADRAVSLLQHEPIGGFHWREREQWGRRLARGDPDDKGRRIFSDACRRDARFVARSAWRAAHGRLPSTAIQWGQIRAAIERIYAELHGGRRRC